MKRSGVQPYHHVGVVGIGGLGHLALQFAHAMRCEVTALSTNPDKREYAFALGADHFVISSDASQMQKATGTPDFVFSAATAPFAWIAYIKALRPNGR
jgi:uncharacterized zinc-type alcohol dehydrogenase-like protein